MSRTNFEEIFEPFHSKFPPVATIQEATLKLSTTEITEMIQDFYPNVDWPRSGITRFMIDQGYKYEPVEVNERVRYFWLIGQGQESLSRVSPMAGGCY
jgi:hypothetical protein